MIKRIYKDFIIAFLNSRGEIPFTFLQERLKEENAYFPYVGRCRKNYLWNICIHPYLHRSINHSLQKSEAFQSVHHVVFILCYTVLEDYLSLVFALIRVHKYSWDNIIQGKQ